MVLRVTDKALLRRRLRRANQQRYPGSEFLLDAAVGELAERLGAVQRRFPVGVAFGSNTETVARALRESGKIDQLFRFEQAAAARRSEVDAVADEEALPIAPQSLDLFVSALALQWTNDLPGTLLQIRQALRPDGLFLAALTGGETLAELRQALFAAESEVRGGASPRVLPPADVRDLGALLQRAGFALPVADRDKLTVRYESAFALFRDLRAMGATNALAERERKPASRRLFSRTAELYAERFSDPDGRIRATFETVYLSGWAPHESQQQPARRGSGQISLADALRPGRPGS